MDLMIVADGHIATVGLVQLVLEQPGMEISVQTRAGNECYTQLNKAWQRHNYLLVRTGDYPALGFVRRLKAARCPNIYYIDDNFWLLLDDNRDHRHYQHPMVRQTLELALGTASRVVCHSERFRKFLLRFNPDVVVIPPHFDFSLVEGVQVQAHNEFRIGVVGNKSRAADIAFLVDVVRDVLSRHQTGIVFEFFGYTPAELEGLEGVRSLATVPDYKTFIRAQKSRGWSLALAPLFDTPFAAYKTNNKLREYGACGIAGIYSDSVVYRECVEHGVTGWLVPNETAAWVDQILDAIDKPEKAAEIAQASLRYVRQHHDLENIKGMWSKLARSVYDRWGSNFIQGMAESRMAKWDAVPAHGQLVFHSRPEATAWLPGERQGYFRRDAVFHLDPGQTIETMVRPPEAGPCCFSTIIGTYMKQLSGELRLEFASHDGVQGQSLDLATVQDNGAVTFRLVAHSDAPMVVRLTNGATEPLALRMCCDRGRTTYLSTGVSYPAGVLA